MQIAIYRMSESHQVKGLCVVIDVLRAFTTAAFAFSKGAKEISIVSTKEEAFSKYREDPELILMGEEKGQTIEGFHLGNSCSEIAACSLQGKRMVQRTTAGTQGVVACSSADLILASSFVIAEATVQRILELSPSIVSLLVTGMQDGEEDLALAEYLRERLQGKRPSKEPYLQRVRNSYEGKIFSSSDYPEFPLKDLELATQVDLFAFAIQVFKEGGDLVARKLPMKKLH